MNKRILSLLLALALLFAMLPQMTLFVSAAGYSGTCGAEGDNLTWSLNTDTGVLTISGSGAMPDFYTTPIPWYDYRDSIQYVSLPNGLTNIGNLAFYQCSALKSLTIPNGVTSIGNESLRMCTSLTSVAIPSSVTYIGDGAFFDCVSLKSMTVPSGVTSLNNGVLYNCSSMKSLSLPNGLVNIGNESIRGCSALTNVSIPATVTTIGDGAFYDCTGLARLTLPSSVTGIGIGAFFHCSSLKSISIPYGVTSIPLDAFHDCSALKSVTLPDSVTEIGAQAFLGCTALEDVTIPESVTSIGAAAFYECAALSEMLFPQSVASIGDLVLYGCESLAAVKVLNPDCVIDATADSLGDPETVTVYGYADSNTQTYANTYGYPFVDISDWGHNTFRVGASGYGAVYQTVGDTLPEKSAKTLAAGEYSFEGGNGESLPIRLLLDPDHGAWIDDDGSLIEEGSCYLNNREIFIWASYTTDAYTFCQEALVEHGEAIQDFVTFEDNRFTMNTEGLHDIRISIFWTEDEVHQDSFETTENKPILVWWNLYGYSEEDLAAVYLPDGIAAEDLVFSNGVGAARVSADTEALTFRWKEGCGLDSILNRIAWEDPEWEEISAENGNFVLRLDQANGDGSPKDFYHVLFFFDASGCEGGHTWNNGAVTTEPTCTEAGVRTYTCTVCGETMTETIPALGHSFSPWEITKPATEDEPGQETHTCTVCSATETREYYLWEYQYYLNYNPLEDVILYAATGDAMPDPETQSMSWDGVPFDYKANEPIRVLIDTAHRLDMDRYEETGDEKQSLIDMDPEADIFVELWSYHYGDEKWEHELVVEHGIAISDKVTFENNLLTFIPTEKGQYDLDFSFSPEQHELFLFSDSEEYPLIMDFRVWGDGTINDPEEVSPENVLRCAHRSGTQLLRYRLPADTETLTFTWPEKDNLSWMSIEGGGNHLDVQIPEEHRFVLPLDWRYTYEGMEDVPINWYIFYLGFSEPANYDWVDRDSSFTVGYNNDLGSVFYALGEEMPTADASDYVWDAFGVAWENAQISFAPEGENQTIRLLLDSALAFPGSSWEQFESGQDIALEPSEIDGTLYVLARYVDENGDWYDGLVVENGEIVKEGWSFENNVLCYTPANNYHVEINVWWREEDYAFDTFGGTEECPVIVNSYWQGDGYVNVPDGISEENFLVQDGRMRVRVPFETESITFTWEGEIDHLEVESLGDENGWGWVEPEGDSYTLMLNKTDETGNPWVWYSMNFCLREVYQGGRTFLVEYGAHNGVVYQAVGDTLPEKSAETLALGEYSFEGENGESLPIRLLLDPEHDAWIDDDSSLIEVGSCYLNNREIFIRASYCLDDATWCEETLVEHGEAVRDFVTFEDNRFTMNTEGLHDIRISIFWTEDEFHQDSFETTENKPILVWWNLYGYSEEDLEAVYLPDGIAAEDLVFSNGFGAARVSADTEVLTFRWKEGCGTLRIWHRASDQDWTWIGVDSSQTTSFVLRLDQTGEDNSPAGFYHVLFFFDAPGCEGGHTWNDGVVTTEPTCTEAGVRTYTCTVCGETLTETIPALGHNHQATVTPPTCTQRGFTRYVCDRCGEGYTDDYVPALGHSYGDWVTTATPTCTEQGIQMRLCTRCSAAETRNLDALGHNYVNGICSNCGARSQAAATLNDLSYAFSNSSSSFGYSDTYRIPLERYQFMYGNTTLAKMLYNQSKPWGGSCFGFSSSSGIFFDKGNTLNPSDFHDAAANPYPLSVGDYSDKDGINVQQLLESMQISQFASLIQSDLYYNRNKLSELCNLVESGDERNPLLIAVFGPQGGHALLGYQLESVSATQTRLHVYDCNFPAQDRYITLSKDSSGAYTKWYYPLNNIYDWGSDYSNCRISFVPYDHYHALWTNRGYLGDLNSALVTINCNSASLADYNGTIIATIEDGELSTTRNDIFQIRPLSITSDGTTSESAVSFWIPTDLYSIISDDSDADELEISVVNLDYSAEISTTASAVTFAVDDAESLNYVQIDEADQAYELHLYSGEGGTEVQLSGTTTDEVLALGVFGDSCYVTGADSEDTSLMVNGVAIGETETGVVDTVPASGVKLSQNELTLCIEDTASLQATVLPDTATNKTVTWSSTNPSVATVSADGLVTAVHEGEAEIIAQIDGVSAACAVTVSKAAPVLENPFDDVAEGKFYYDAVLWAVNHEPQVTNGTDATHFSPDATCTRGQVVTFLWRAKGCPEPTKTDNPFEDVTGGFYYQAVLWAVENGITAGMDATHFGPGEPCTRGQVVTFLWRTEGKPEPTSENNPFEDVTGGFYYKAVLWAVENKITAGMDATHFAPMNTCTRGQIVTFLYRDLAE